MKSTVLAKLALPFIAALNMAAAPYEVGKTTSFELRHGIDLVGEFTSHETSLLECVVETISDAYPKAFTPGELTIEKVDTIAESRFASGLKIKRGPADFLIKLVPSETIDYFRGRDPTEVIRNYDDVIAHECAHYFLDRFDSASAEFAHVQRLKSSFAELNKQVPLYDPALRERQIGFVSSYADNGRYMQYYGDLLYDQKEVYYQQAFAKLAELREVNDCFIQSLNNTFSVLDYAQFLQSLQDSSLVIPSVLPYMQASLAGGITAVERDSIFILGREFGKDVHLRKYTLERYQIIDQTILTVTFGLENPHPSSEESSVKEDLAETFAYILGEHHYADSDSLVEKKIDMVTSFMQQIYGR
ncbi:hypothetical protein C4573_04735 [Candidatus Woesearchaeota archaeon]|nr:MAG: hypothetical protein C4573_04735 [Candidatus Woesearchaeota archaeon]